MTDKASEPWQWGVNDCCTFAADWIMANGHVDPMRRWRGKYDSEEAARDHILGAEGLAMLWLLGTMDAVLPEPDVPAIGDVGVVRMETPEGPQEVGAIYGGKRWHFLTERGLVAASVEPVAVWRV